MSIDNIIIYKSSSKGNKIKMDYKITGILLIIKKKKTLKTEHFSFFRILYKW